LTAESFVAIRATARADWLVASFGRRRCAHRSSLLSGALRRSRNEVSRARARALEVESFVAIRATARADWLVASFGRRRCAHRSSLLSGALRRSRNEVSRARARALEVESFVAIRATARADWLVVLGVLRPSQTKPSPALASLAATPRSSADLRTPLTQAHAMIESGGGEGRARPPRPDVG
jgi:hypothetical protein